MTLSFRISKIDTHPSKEEFAKSDLDFNNFISVNGDFELCIEGNSVLRQENWNIAELAYQLVEWKKEDFRRDFQYRCIDAVESDLFTFKKFNGGFQFFSEWSDNNSKTVFDKKTIKVFIESYSKSVKLEIKNQLGFDVSQYLQ